jgi:hypothetical protein
MTLWANIGNALGGLSALFKKVQPAALAEIAIGSAIGLINGLDIAKICKRYRTRCCICLSIFMLHRLQQFGAVSRAKSVLSGADSAGAGSMEVVLGGGVTLPTSMFSFKTHHNHKFQILYKFFTSTK